MNGILSVSSDSNSDNEFNITIQTQTTKKNKWTNLDKSFFQNETKPTTTKSQRRKPIRRKLNNTKLLTKWDLNSLTQPKIIKVSNIEERRSILNIINKIVPDTSSSTSIISNQENYTIDDDSTSSCSGGLFSQSSLNIKNSPIKHQTPEDKFCIEDHDSEDGSDESIKNLELAVLEHYNISPIESSNSSTNTVTNFQTRSIPSKKIKHKKGGIWEKIDKCINRQISNSNLWAYTRSNDSHLETQISDIIVVTGLENVFGRNVIGFKKDEKDSWIILDPNMRMFAKISIGTSLEVVLEGNQHTIDGKIIFTGIRKIALPKGRKISIFELQKQQNEQ